MTPAPGNVRDALHHLMAATEADEQAHGTWTYDDNRPQAIEPAWKPGQQVRSDCSNGTRKLARWAGAPDPAGLDFGPFGNSTTICLHLPHLSSVAELEIGDIVTFGPNGDEHAAMVYEPGWDPILWSDGHQGAPNFYRLSDDGREHQLLKLPVPHLVISPQEHLRELTGFWSWIAWNEGEGQWRHYGRRNPHVRPNVPARVSGDWLRRLRAFDANRHKGNPPRPHTA